MIPTRFLYAVGKPKAPFKTAGNTFDTLFVNPETRRKAWDGQDKDAFFRDKYAHVHAKQLKRKKEEQELKRQKLGSKAFSKPIAKPEPKKDFAQRFAELQLRQPTVEYIFGTNAVKAGLQTRKCHKLFTGVRSVADIDPEILALCRDRDVPVESNVPAQHLMIMSDQGVHNKYVAKMEKRKIPIVESLEVGSENIVLNCIDKSTLELPLKNTELRVNFKHPLGLFIDQVTDAHNMGALLRSAQFFGADFVAISSRNSSPISPTVVKASSGASEFIPILEIGKPLRFFDHLRETGWAVVATAPNPETLKQHEIQLEDKLPSELKDLDRPTMLVVGSEGDGIRTSLVQRSTHKTTIPTNQPYIDSLNVSVAAAVLLSAF